LTVGTPESFAQTVLANIRLGRDKRNDTFAQSVSDKKV